MKLNRLFRGHFFIGIDGVLADLEGEFCSRFGFERRMIPNLEDRYPKHYDMAVEFLNSPDTYTDLSPIFGGMLLARQAKYRGYKVSLVTSRRASLLPATESWLKRYNVGYDTLYGEVWDRESFVESFPEQMKLLVDDMAHNMPRRAKINGILWSQPWNQQFNIPRIVYNSMNMRLEVISWNGVVDFWSGK